MTASLLHDGLRRSAVAHPGRVAVTGTDCALTYAELDALSNRCANALRRQGVVPGDRVGIDLEKSPAAIVAMLGILKTGASYVPLDPRAPARRSAYIVGDCGLAGLATTPERLSRLAPELGRVPAARVLFGDTAAVGWQDFDRDPASPPPESGVAEQVLAYILYTSGSTGQPKGVMLSHRAALAFVDWAVAYFRLRPEDVLASHAPLHFDLSIFDIFAGLAAGARVALVPPAASVFPRGLADWIAGQHISVWYSVPSVLAQLALKGGLERHGGAAPRLVLFAGEVFPVPHLRQLMQLWPAARYFNLYGPTETNVCTVYAVPGVPAEDAPPLPIGTACAGHEVLALRADGQPAAEGEEGEMYISGPGLMEGYRGAPELTGRVLGPHPLRRGAPPAYRTGDIVRRDTGGNYHFIGRRDLQVKSRGYRIELGDIEATLHNCPDIAEAVVVALPHAEFGSLLHAVVIPRPGANPVRATLAAWCAGQLPPYMVPTAFTFRTELPRTPNGKVDRRALQLEVQSIPAQSHS